MKTAKEKIYARTLDPQFFDYRVYEDMVKENKDIFIDGLKDYCSIQGEVLKALKEFSDNYGYYEYEVYYHNSIKEYVDYAFPKKENGKAYSPKELHTIKQMLDSESSYRYYSEFLEEFYILALGLIKSQPYERRILRGCCQGEVAYCYCPVDTDHSYTDWIEAWFFGTGIEIEIDDTGRSEINDGSDIIGYTFYTDKWREEDLKQEILNQCYWASKDDEPEVVLWQFDGYTKTPKYKAS